MDDPLLTILGENIRHHRKCKSLSQEVLAELSNTHRTYISQLEQGKRNPTFLTLKHIASALECSLTDLFLTETEAQHEL